MKIEKSIVINRNSELVFDYLRMTKNQDNFSVWNMTDADMKKNTGKTKFQITSNGVESTSVAWIFDSPSKFPMSLFSPLFKIMLGKDLEKGLVNLKRILEKQ